MLKKLWIIFGCEYIVTNNSEEILKCEKIILPGVGAFKDAMNKIKKLKLDKILIEEIKKGKPFLGICLGFQMLFDKSQEGGNIKGLGVLKGEILKFPKEINLKIPQIGWNNIKIKNKSKLFDGIKNEPFVYFVHSYYLQTKDKTIVASKTKYGIEFVSSIEKGNIFRNTISP